VLDGDLDEFMAATLRSARSERRRARSRMWTNEWQKLLSLASDAWARHGRRYLEGGFRVAVWNRSRSKADDLIARGARWAASPADAADGADAVVTMVADDEASRAVWLGKDGAALTAKAGTLAIECSTVHTGMRSISRASFADAVSSISIVRSRVCRMPPPAGI